MIPIGCRERAIATHPVEFPGFSLEVPTFLGYSQDPAATYRKGEAAGGDRERVRVSWHDGALTTPEEMPTVMRAASAAPAGSARSIKVGAQDATRLDAGAGAERVSLIDVTCGRRSVMISLRGVGDALTETILASFDCQPIAAPAQAIADRALIGVDDPGVLAGWHRVPAEPGAFVISNGTVSIDFGEIRQAGLIGLDKITQQTLRAYGPVWTTVRTERRDVGGRERVIELGTVMRDGKRTAAAFTIWLCEPGTDAIAATATSSGEDHAPALEVLAKARCARDGDPPISFAPAAK